LFTGQVVSESSRTRGEVPPIEFPVLVPTTPIIRSFAFVVVKDKPLAALPHPGFVFAVDKAGSNGELMLAPVTARARPTRVPEVESVNVIVYVPGDEARAHQQDSF